MDSIAHKRTAARRFFIRSKEKSSDLDHVGKESEVQVFYQNTQNTGNEAAEWVEWAPPKLPAPKKKKFEGAAIQVYRKLMTDPTPGQSMHWTSEIRLQSPLIRDALAADLEKQGLVFTSGVASSQAPHMALFFCREKIAEVSKIHDDAVTRSHCKLLCDVIQDNLTLQLDAYEDYEKEQTIEWGWLWTLFPADLVYGVAYDKNICAFRVLSVSSTDSAYQIKSEFVRFDGNEYKLQTFTSEVNWYLGKKKLSELAPYGLVDLARNPEERERLRLRGIKALEYQAPTFRQFTPLLVPSNFVNHLQEKSRVVVDHFLHMKQMNLNLRSLPTAGKEPKRVAGATGAVGQEVSTLGQFLQYAVIILPPIQLLTRIKTYQATIDQKTRSKGRQKRTSRGIRKDLLAMQSFWFL
jgi:hypothetical protein